MGDGREAFGHPSGGTVDMVAALLRSRRRPRPPAEIPRPVLEIPQPVPETPRQAPETSRRGQGFAPEAALPVPLPAPLDRWSFGAPTARASDGRQERSVQASGPRLQ
jgi:hypothetical protein